MGTEVLSGVGLNVEMEMFGDALVVGREVLTVGGNVGSDSLKVVDAVRDSLKFGGVMVSLFPAVPVGSGVVIPSTRAV